MNIAITFRHLEPSDAVKQYAHDKVAKLQKFLRQPMHAAVTLGLEKLDHVIEARVSAGSDHWQAREQSPDMYASIDKVIDKLERQIRASKDVEVSKKHGGPKAGEFVAAQAEVETEE